MSRRALRWAILGTGRISESFVSDLRTSSEAVTAVWGRREEAAADFGRRHGIPMATTDLDEIFASDADLVYVATPAATHRDIAIRALSAGKHVLVEKPMAMTPEDVSEIFDCAAAHDRFAMEAMWMKFNPLHTELLRRISAGEIGEPTYFRGGFGFPFPAGGSRWDADLGGSVLFNQAIYTVTLAEWELGPVNGTIAVSGVARNDVDVAADVTLSHRLGVSHHAVSALSLVDPSASLSGEKGWIEIPGMFWATTTATVHTGSFDEMFDHPEIVAFPREGNGYVPMIRSVSEAIGDGARQHPLHDAQATASVIGVLRDARAAILDLPSRERGRSVLASRAASRQDRFMPVSLLNTRVD